MISQMTENLHVQRKIELLAQKNPSLPGSPSPETRLQKQRQDSLSRPALGREILKQKAEQTRSDPPTQNIQPS